MHMNIKATDWWGVLVKKKRPLETCHWRMTNYQPDVRCLKQSDTPDAIISVCHSGGDTLLQSVTSTLQAPYGHLVPFPRGGRGRKLFSNQNRALLCLFFFFFQRFTAWVKIINIWPTEQLDADEKFCLHPTWLVFQQRGGTLDTQKLILNNTGYCWDDRPL